MLPFNYVSRDASLWISCYACKQRKSPAMDWGPQQRLLLKPRKHHFIRVKIYVGSTNFVFHRSENIIFSE